MSSCFNCIMQLISFPSNGLSASVMVNTQKEADKRVHTLLIHYVNICKRHGVCQWSGEGGGEDFSNIMSAG